MKPEIRQPHATLGRYGRLRKAQKIIGLLVLRPSGNRPVRVLEVGTGSGGIAQYFSELLGEHGTVNAVDVTDQRVVSRGYQFEQVKSTALPFPAGMFDTVISNHVIEHVGTVQDQKYHHQFAQTVKALAGAERQIPITARLAAAVSASVLQMLRVVSPTRIYLFAKNQTVLVNA